jgi:hypothetical protein
MKIEVGKSWRLRPRPKQVSGAWKAKTPLQLPTSYKVIVDPHRQMLASVARLRVSVWRERDRSFPPEIISWHDRWDDEAIHIVVLGPEETPVAAARVSFHESLATAPDGALLRDAGVARPADATGRIAVFSRLVIHPSQRNLGLHVLIDQIRFQLAVECGASCVAAWVTAAQGRIETLSQLGFVQVGENRTSQTPERRAEGESVLGGGSVILCAPVYQTRGVGL